MRTTRRLFFVSVTLAALAGCGGGGSRASSRAAAAVSAGSTTPAPSATSPTTTSGSGATSSAGGGATAPTTTATLPSPRVINILSAAGSGAGAPVTSSTSTSTSTTAGTGTAPAVNPAGAALWGTIPPDLTTGFDGRLFLVGERLVPGSVLLVTVNGVPTKFLPATFHSSGLLSTFVYLTVAATYDFAAVAPDGTTSAPVTFTVRDGGTTTLLGLNPPDVQMVYPTHLDGSFAGTVWLLGDQFMPGAVATIQQPGLPALVTPLVVVNERAAAWLVGPLVQGSVTVTVTNPTLLSSTALTLPVGAAPPGGAPGATPSVYMPGGVTSPFLGTVTVYGADLALGAAVELRPVGATGATQTPLVRLSSGEAWWSLVYPAAGHYEVRVVNPGGAASPWTPFDVR